MPSRRFRERAWRDFQLLLDPLAQPRSLPLERLKNAHRADARREPQQRAG